MMQKTSMAQGIAHKWFSPMALIAVAMFSGFVLGRSVDASAVDVYPNQSSQQAMVEAHVSHLLNVEENASAERDETFRVSQVTMAQARRLNAEENSSAERDLAFQNSQRMLTSAGVLNAEENTAADRDATFRRFQWAMVEARVLSVEENAAADRDATFRGGMTQ